MGAMPAVAEPKKTKKDCPLKVIDCDRKKYNLDGSIKRTHPNKKAGESSEVFAFKTEEEIKAMIDVFDKHIADAPDDNKEQLAHRNKLMFLLGIHMGLRASDLRMLKWSFFFDKDKNFIDDKVKRAIKPKKTRETEKYVPIFVTSPMKRAITDYVQKHPVEDIDTYVFASRKFTGRKRENDNDVSDSKGNMPIAESSIWRILNDTASEAGINQNIGSHSLRKTFGYWMWHNAVNKEAALTTLQIIFNHSSTQITAKYIGITDDEIFDMYNSIDLGFDFI